MIKQAIAAYFHRTSDQNFAKHHCQSAVDKALGYQIDDDIFDAAFDHHVAEVAAQEEDRMVAEYDAIFFAKN